MRQGTRKEFEALKAVPHSEIRRFVDCGGRVVETHVSKMGRTLAMGTTVYARRNSRKVQCETFLVSETYVPL